MISPKFDIYETSAKYKSNRGMSVDNSKTSLNCYRTWVSDGHCPMDTAHPNILLQKYLHFLSIFFFIFINSVIVSYSNVGRLFCTPAPPKSYEKACCGFFFQLRELISTKITFIIHFMTAPLIFLIHCIKKVEKLTVENFHFPHLILVGLTFKESTLENSHYL